MRLTKKRQQILDTLEAHRGILTAKTLHAKLPDIDLVTIYRALDVFVVEGVVTKLMLNHGEASYEYQHEPHHHAVCVDCDRVIHFTAPNEKLQQLLGLEDFAVEHIDVTVRGHCNKDK